VDKKAVAISSKASLWRRLYFLLQKAKIRSRSAREAEELPGYIPGYGYPIGWAGTDRVLTVQATKEQAQAIVDSLNATAARSADREEGHGPHST
jgi:hypothetical protein